MANESNLQFVFNDVVAGTTRAILFRDKQEFESTRTALLRKFRQYKMLLDGLGGADPFEGKFLRCRWEREECRGVFYIEDTSQRQNNPAKILQVVDL